MGHLSLVLQLLSSVHSSCLLRFLGQLEVFSAGLMVGLNLRGLFQPK